MIAHLGTPRSGATRSRTCLILLLCVAASVCGCRSSEPSADAGAAPTEPSAAASTLAVQTPSAAPAPPSASVEPPAVAQHEGCPDEMILVPARKPVCVDRWEAILVDKSTGERLSPHYPVHRKLALKLEADWQEKRKTLGSAEAQAMPVPPLPAWQRDNDAEPVAVSRADQVPNGYLSGKVAKLACENAGKRLCRRDEWVRACRGKRDLQYPYGESYKQGVCNVFRSSHPAGVLHDDPSMGHLDPRLLLVEDKDGPLLRKTGAVTKCKSAWGDDALYEMVGNLDEWVEDPKGMFVGGFFSRSKKDGCESVITAHPNDYFDYSLGVRCCRDPET